jgi:hypothetical protein
MRFNLNSNKPRVWIPTPLPCSFRNKALDPLIPDIMGIKDQGLIPETLDPDSMLMPPPPGTMLFLLLQDILLQQGTPLHVHKQQQISDLLSPLDLGHLVRYVARHPIKPLIVSIGWTMLFKIEDPILNCKP